ncbi:MAG: glycosyltransferase [Porticoccaceae bacterium]
MNTVPRSSDMPRVAVLMAACNGMQWLDEQIASILHQEGVRVQLFISIDPSTDGTETFCRQLAADDGRVATLPGVGPGSPAGNFFRLMLEIPAGDYDFVALADQDDIWLPDKLASAILHMQRHQAAGYSSSFTAFWPDGRQTLMRKDHPQRRWDFLFESPGPGCSFVLTPPLHRAIQENLSALDHPPASLIYHDVYIYAFARANGYRWVIDPHSRLLYRQHPDNAVGVNRGWRALWFRLQMILTGHGLEQSLRMADAVGIGQSAFVRGWRRLDRGGIGFLLRHAWQCRRKPSHRLFFALVMIALWLRHGFVDSERQGAADRLILGARDKEEDKR